MDRIDVHLQAECERLRAELLENCARGGDDDLLEDERPDRTETSPGCLLKPYDDVIVDETPCRYILPGRGQHWMYVVFFSYGSVNLAQYEDTQVTDRAPVDPEETPMPILPEVTEGEALPRSTRS
jgi:hypothetical protein